MSKPTFRTRYTVDSQGRIRAYYGREAWEHLRRPNEKRVRLRDLPKGFKIWEEWTDYDV